MVGQDISLHMAMPVFVSTSCMTCIMPVSNLFISTTGGYQYCQHQSGPIVPTLVGQPFSEFDVLWLGSQSQEVAFDGAFCIFLIQELLRILFIVDALLAEG